MTPGCTGAVISTFADQTAWASALKTVYSPDEVENEVYQDQPFHAMLKKDEKFVGKNFQEVLLYANPQGRAVTIAGAQANLVPSSIAGFTLTRVSDYAVAGISNETIMSSAGDKGALLQALTTEIDGALHVVGRSLGIAEFRDGTGVIGTIGSIAGAVVTLLYPDDITNFELNMSMDSFTDTTFATQHSNGVLITNINRQLGTFTLASTTGAPAAGDVLVSHGDAGAKLSGLAAWLPATAPTSTAFFGQDRSKDTTRLAGVISPVQTLSPDEAWITTAKNVGREGGAPDFGFCDFSRWGDLVKTLGSQVRYIDLKVNPLIGFQGVELNGPKGRMKIIPDRNCPVNVSYLLTMRTWTLRSLGQAPMIIETDGNKVLRDASDDAVQVRVGYYAQLGCNAPAYNAVMLNQ